jgi:3'5'-cyclic nucleotide phosphodiesterase
MESTGMKGCIHISQETADEITVAGKSAWIKERQDKVIAKGKGELTTFWLSLTDHSSSGDAHSEGAYARLDASTFGESDTKTVANAEGRQSSSYQAGRKSAAHLSGKSKRLIEWNVDILLRLLTQIAKHQAIANSSLFDRARTSSSSSKQFKHQVDESAKPEMVMDEVSEVIQLPRFSSKIARAVDQADDIELPTAVKVQLYEFVSEIAGMYHDNPFHNFEHASHVTMSVVKLLSRIVVPADLDYDDTKTANDKKLLKNMASKMHDHTYGITSDPLTQFAVVLSALIHDADHFGVPNALLVKEDHVLAKRYKSKSVAEQNSIDVAWKILMEPRFENLRNAICCNESEWIRFRKLIVNSVMATDIVDKELKELRNTRWDKAFKGDFIEEDRDIDRNRKATIVIEHLIQASDISHTMQHWHIYRKWNERLFFELYRAYKEGRAENDPSEFWYKGEIGFFTFYIVSYFGCACDSRLCLA